MTMFRVPPWRCVRLVTHCTIPNDFNISFRQPASAAVASWTCTLRSPPMTIGHGAAARKSRSLPPARRRTHRSASQILACRRWAARRSRQALSVGHRPTRTCLPVAWRRWHTYSVTGRTQRRRRQCQLPVERRQRRNRAARRCVDSRPRQYDAKSRWPPWHQTTGKKSTRWSRQLSCEWTVHSASRQRRPARDPGTADGTERCLRLLADVRRPKRRTVGDPVQFSSTPQAAAPHCGR